MARSQSPSNKRPGKKLLLAFGAMVAALLAAEVVCRAIGLPEKPHRV